jgi:hypothetical protein
MSPLDPNQSSDISADLADQSETAINSISPTDILNSSNYDPAADITTEHLSPARLSELITELKLIQARSQENDSETKKINAQALRATTRTQGKLARGVMYGTAIMFAGTFIASIFGACHPGVDKEFLKLIMLTVLDKWFQLILLVAAYYFGRNGKD